MNKFGLRKLIEPVTRILLGNSCVRNYILAPQIVKTSALSQSLDHLSRSYSSLEIGSNDSAEPVFVLSAGWGTGSTLVQRLIISSGDYLIWGEPFDEAAPIQRMAESLHAIREGFPPSVQFTDDYSAESLSKAWIANLVPPMENYRAAHKAFLDTWLTENTASQSYKHWGLKEVRLNIDHARYLKWLYPNAKFVFVYRDVYASYLSCRRKPWISVWPSYKASPIISFSHHWNYLLRGFIDHHESVGGILVKYEDLVSGSYDVDKLSDYLNIGKIDKKLLEKKIGGRSANRRPLIFPEKLVIDSIAGPLRKELGYRS